MTDTQTPLSPLVAKKMADLVNCSRYSDYIEQLNNAIRTQANAGLYEVTCRFYEAPIGTVSWLKAKYTECGYVVSTYGDFDITIAWRP